MWLYHHQNHRRCEVLTVVWLMIHVFWHVTTRQIVTSHWCSKESFQCQEIIGQWQSISSHKTLIFSTRTLYSWNTFNQHISVLTVALSDLLATFQKERTSAYEICNRNTLLGESKQKHSHILVRNTWNIGKMEFVKSYNSVKHNDEMDLKQRFRFDKGKVNLFLCTPRK